jgi:formylglycine-generating enzyme required for sulfatase activity
MPTRFLTWLGLLIACAGLATAQDGPPPPPERMFVLVVGIERYSDPKITDLAYTEDDAQAVYDFFAKDTRSPTIASRVKLLRGKVATRIGVLREIRDHLVRQAVGPSDTAILYFAGHGFADANGVYLAAADTRLDDLQFSAIAWSELERLWSQIRAGRRVLLADACHSGGLAGLRGFGGITKAGLRGKAKVNTASVVVAATGSNQLSVEDKQRKHGVFTASLLDGLGGAADANRDGTTSLGEVLAHLKVHVPQLAKKAGGNQEPTLSIRGSATLARRLVLATGKARPRAAASTELARVKAERRAAEAEREQADLRARLAEATLEKLKGASEAERRAAQAEARRLRDAATKAQERADRLEAEESKRIKAEARAAKAEAEAARLRRRLAELEGKKGPPEEPQAPSDPKGLVHARKLKTEGAAAYRDWTRLRKNGLPAEAEKKRQEAHKKLRQAAVALNAVFDKYRDKDGFLRPEYEGYEVELIEVAQLLIDIEKGAVAPSAAKPKPSPASPSDARARTSAALERAKRLPGFRYLDTKSFTCGGRAFEIARFSHAKTGLVFHLVPGGSYLREIGRSASGDKRHEKVTIKPFLICATECTQEAWKRVTGKAPSHFQGARRPVERVSWDDAQSFGRQAGLRLPSEAEWEHACRAGSSGNSWHHRPEAELERYAVFWSKNRAGPQTQEVGGRLPNAFGLFDVHGNVREWCQDGYVEDYAGAPADGSARGPAGASGRVRRGGGWRSSAWSSNSARRDKGSRSGRHNDLGLRPAKSLP